MRNPIYILACAILALAIIPAVGFAEESVASDVSDDGAVAIAATATDGGNAPAGEDAAQESEQPDDEILADETSEDPAEELSDGISEEHGEQAAPMVTEDNATEADEFETPGIAEDNAGNQQSALEQEAENELADPMEPENDKAQGEAAAAPAEATAVVATPKADVVNKAAVSAEPEKKAATKPAKKASASKSYLANNAIYYISSALGKKGAFSVSLKDILGKPKTNVVLAKKVKQLIQYWRVETKGDGIYRFANCASGYYLAVKGTVKSKANVYLAKKKNIDWKLKKNSDGTFSLRPATGDKCYLSISGGAAKKGANIRLWGSVSNNAQRFVFVKNKRLTKASANGKTVEPGIVKIKLAGSGTPVYVANSTKRNNNKAKTAAASNALNQVYQLRYRGNGLYEFQNANSYKVLTIYKNSKKVGAKTVQYKRTLGLNQLWYFKKVEGGYQIVSARSGLAVDIDGGKAATGKALLMAKPSKAKTQAYVLEETQLVPNGTYVFQSAMALPMVLSVQGSSKKDGANVELKRSSGSKGEIFKVKRLKNGNYRIFNATTKKNIEVAGSSKKNGANIQMAAATGAANQQWIIELGDNGLMFKSALSGKYLNVNSSQAKSKANVDQRTASGNANQCWTIAPSDWKFYAGASSSAMKLIKKAETYEGWRYYWGGRDPSTSFDCAGLVMYCSNKAWGTHFDLMNTNAEMLYDMCTHISAKDAKPGDLVFYRGTYGSDISYISHVVIFAGNGYMYGAGDPIGYAKVNAVKNFRGNTATAVYARIRH